MSNDEVHSNYMVSQFSPNLVNCCQQLFPENSDLTFEEVLQQQVSVYQSLQEHEKNKGSSSDCAKSSWLSRFSGEECESSWARSGASDKSHLALDEALAICLQELGDDFSDIDRSEPIYTAGYKNGEELITLPCALQYHSTCITQWLKVNKNCPVCKLEVRDD